MVETGSQYNFLKDAIQRVRLNRPEDMFALLQTVYALHHDYSIIEMSPDDFFLRSSKEAFAEIRLRTSNPEVAYIISHLSNNLFNHEDYQLSAEEYHELVELIFSHLSRISYASISSSLYPMELSMLYRYIIQKYNCYNIYNPFAGMASIGAAMHGLGVRYIGQEISHDTFHWAELRLDACNIGKAFFRADSINEWIKGQFDAVVAMLPWGMKLAGRYDGFERRFGHSFEDYFYRRALIDNSHANIIVGCSSNSFCTSFRSSETRALLCRERVIDTIIELPNILSSTSMTPSIIIITPNQQHDYIRFIKAKSALSKGSRRKVLDVAAVVKMMESLSDTVVNVDYRQIEKSSYVLASEYYQVLADDVEPGQELVALKDIASYDRGMVVRSIEEPALIVEQSDFSSDFYDICTTPIHINLSNADERVVYRKLFGPHIVLSTRGGHGISIYWHREDTEFLITSGFPLKVYSNRILPEYLIYLLLKSRQLLNFVSGTAIGRYVERDSEYLLNYHMAIVPEIKKQNSIVKSIIRKEIQERQKVLDAVKARQNITTAAGDLAHMLGTPFLAQQNIISRIQDYEGDKNLAEYTSNVNALIAASSYIQRIVNAMNADFATASFVREPIDLGAHVKEYIKNILISEIVQYPIDASDIQDGVTVKADVTMLQILLDSIIENACRHGFRREKRSEYKISVSVEKVIFNEEAYALLTIKNNGYAMPDSFSIDDYISKGRFNGESGRSGLGGYHVYSITKKHNGYMFLRSDEEWNFIIDVLLPLTASEDNNVYNTYDYEAI